jgi:hypothetical protein
MGAVLNAVKLAQSAVWIWRVLLLAALLWVGFELREIRHSMPGGLAYDTEQQIRAISIDLEKTKSELERIERNTRR